MFETILILNVIWFSMAFNVFALRSKILAKILVSKEHRDSPVFAILAESGKFLGGFNLAFAFCKMLLNTDVGLVLLLE